MIKYPYELSEQRLSLLPKKERELYRYEHSDYFSYTEKLEMYEALQECKQSVINEYLQQINESEELNDLSDGEKYDAANILMETELDEDAQIMISFIHNDIIEAYTKEEAELVEAELVKQFKLLNEATLNEDSPGSDMTWWTTGLGKKLGILLGAGIGVVGYLLMQGHDKLAQKKLEQYMNKMVEEADDGVNKKKSLFSFFKNAFSKNADKNRGNQTTACFRFFQEEAQRNQLKNMLVLAKNCGFLSDSDAISQAETQTFKGGLFSDDPHSFKVQIADKIDRFIK